MKRRGIAVLFGLGTIAVLIAIWVLTEQSAHDTSALSAGVVRRLHAWALRLANNQLPDSTARTHLITALTWAGTHVRKLAHTIEFLPVGLFTAAAVLTWRGGRWRTATLITIATLVCVVTSIGDQIHKTYVPGRYFDATDLPWDAAGYLTGILLATAIWALGRSVRRLTRRLTSPAAH